MEVAYKPIGYVRTPFTSLDAMPIQPSSTASAPGVAEILPQYVEGLKDLDGFSHVILVYHLHCAGRAKLTVTPFLDSSEHGVFATRAPCRPNPIGLSIVPLLAVEGSRLLLGDLDVLDGTPLLDVKPYIPDFDQPTDVRVGWLESSAGEARSATSDLRFS